MPSPEMALIQDGSLTGASNITALTGVVVRQHKSRNTTNTGSGTAAEHKLGRWVYETSLRGTWDTGSNTYPLPVGAASANGPIGRLSRIRIQKRQVLKNVTAGPDGVDDMEFSGGVITYVGRGTGYLQSTEAPLGTDSAQTIAQAELSAFQIPLDSTRNITADAILTNIGKNMRFTVGGAVLVDFDFTLTGAVTLNGTANPFDQTSYTASLDSDNGDNWAGTVKIRSMEADIDYENGVPTLISVQGPFSGSPAVTITPSA